MQNRKPELTLTSRLLIKAAGRTDAWSEMTQWCAAFAAFGVVLALDVVTGAQVTLFFLYLLLGGAAAWSFGERKGLLFAGLMALSGAGLQHWQYASDPHHEPTAATEIWNACTRLLSIELVVVLISGMRTALRLERWRASTDGLTGVLNKASFHRDMAAAITAARGTDSAFILCYMDLDGFKQVNDRHGHCAGDEVLRIFASAAVDAIRAEDLFARIGGDEFIALLSIRASEDGDYIAALVHKRLSSILAKTGLPVSCSMGALVTTADQLDPLDAAVQLADSLMYEVKKSGKAALRVGRIDPVKALTAPDCLQIHSDPVTSSIPGKKSDVMIGDRRAA